MTTTSATGFIVHGMVQSIPRRDGGRRSRLAYLGRLDDGRTFAAVWDDYRPGFLVRATDRLRAADILKVPQDSLEDSPLSTMDGQPTATVTFGSVAGLRSADELLRAHGVRTYEADLSPADPFLIDHQIHGSIALSGPASPGHQVDLVFMNPEVAPSEWEPRLEVLALDIETNPLTGEILAVSLVSSGEWTDRVAEVHFYGAPVNEPWIVLYPSDEALLRGVLARINELDPDLITGWNVIDFDIAMIDGRLRHYGIPFTISRSSEPTRFMGRSRGDSGRRQNAGVTCPGRQVVDGLRLVRYGPERFDDRKLGSVATAVLGVGKTVEAETSREKIATLLTLYREDPVAFCEYCRTDSDLVLRILDKTGLLALTLKRCRLIGISLHRAWTSIPAFDFLYIESMHKRGLVAPTLGVDPLPGGEAPGGAILKPIPGLHRNVLVF
ncbi:MAG: hypothetical protein E4H09_03005, partial [Spirochaetales bacterium]